jgi:hypothetical protein
MVTSRLTAKPRQWHVIAGFPFDFNHAYVQGAIGGLFRPEHRCLADLSAWEDSGASLVDGRICAICGRNTPQRYDVKFVLDPMRKLVLALADEHVPDRYVFSEVDHTVPCDFERC